VNWRRFSWVVALFAGAIVVIALYATREGERARQAAAQSDAQPSTSPGAATRTTGGAEAPATRPAPATAASGTATAASTSAPATPPPASAATGQGRIGWYDDSIDQPLKYTIGSLDPKSGYLSQAELYSQGASIYTVKLAGYFATVDDKRLYEKDPAAYGEAQRKEPRKYQGNYSVLNPVSFGDKVYLPLMTRKLIMTFLDTKERPESAEVGLRNWRMEAPASQPADSQTIRFVCRLTRGTDWDGSQKNPVLKLVKAYTVRKNSYSIDVSLHVENLTARPIEVWVDQVGPTGVPQDDLYDDRRQAVYAKRKPDGTIQPTRRAKTEAGSMALGQPDVVGSSETNEPVLWIGEVSKFFGSVLYLVPNENERKQNLLNASDLKARFYMAPVHETADSLTFLTGVEIPSITLAGRTGDPNAAYWREVQFDLFAGPKKRDMFTGGSWLLPRSPYFQQRYKDLEYMGTIDLSGCWCAFESLALGVMWLLEVFAHWLTFGNSGLAIILLVVLVRLVLHPLTKKGQVSMNKMQKLSPKIAKLKEKHKDDKVTLQKETMKLYKEAGATPILGCLPMLLQMPIWIALWTGINAATELRHAAFIPFWLTDLAAPDALISWSFYIPLVGYSLNLLPILLTVAMYYQSKITPQMTGATTPQQAQQQKMMKWMMPILMLFIFYKMPSGLTLYVMASTFAGLWEQRVIRKHIEQKEAAAAAVETCVGMPGKASRTSRPKKPKGPFWFKHG